MRARTHHDAGHARDHAERGAVTPYREPASEPLDACEECPRGKAAEIAERLSPLARANVRIMAAWGRGESGPPCLVHDDVTPLCKREGIGWVPTDALHAVDAALAAMFAKSFARMQFALAKSAAEDAIDCRFWSPHHYPIMLHAALRYLKKAIAAREENEAPP